MIGKTFGDFTITSKLGEGNMGIVYLATQNSLDRDVALKIIKKESDKKLKSFRRFIQEAKIAAAIQHPNIVNIYSVGEEGNYAYLAMEYIKGCSLEDKIIQGNLPEKEAFQIALSISQGLEVAWKEGIIHRDIKPENILLRNEKIPTLADFGLSKRLGLEEDDNITQDGLILGTPRYLSPEQASGEKVQFYSDIYSLGATLYYALTQSPLFVSDLILDVILKHKFELPSHPWEHNKGIKEEACFILAKMLYKDPTKRYASYHSLIEDIEAYLQEKPLIHANSSDAKVVYKNIPFQIGTKRNSTQRIFRSIKEAFSGFPKKTTIKAELKPETPVIAKSTEEKPVVIEPVKKQMPPVSFSQITPENKEIEKKEKETNQTKEEPQNIQELSSKINVKETARFVLPKELVKDVTSDSQEFFDVIKTSCRKNFQQICYKFGHYLVECGRINSYQLSKAFDIQQTVNRKIGQIAFDEGYILTQQLENILKVQRKIKKRFGELAIQMGILKSTQVNFLLELQDKHYINISDILARERILPESILEEEHQRFSALQVSSF